MILEYGWVLVRPLRVIMGVAEGPAQVRDVDGAIVRVLCDWERTVWSVLEGVWGVCPAVWRKEERAAALWSWKGSNESIAMVAGSWGDEEESGIGGGEGEGEEPEILMTDCCGGSCLAGLSAGVMRGRSLASRPCFTNL